MIERKESREKIKIIDTKFSRPFPIPPKSMFPESACIKTNFGTYLEFLFLAVAEKSLGEVGQFGIFFAFSAIDGLTKFFITFDRPHRFSRMIACFKGHSMSVRPTFLEI
jgi:hypothetical protein